MCWHNMYRIVIVASCYACCVHKAKEGNVTKYCDITKVNPYLLKVNWLTIFKFATMTGSKQKAWLSHHNIITLGQLLVPLAFHTWSKTLISDGTVVFWNFYYQIDYSSVGKGIFWSKRNDVLKHGTHLPFNSHKKALIWTLWKLI